MSNQRTFAQTWRAEGGGSNPEFHTTPRRVKNRTLARVLKALLPVIAVLGQAVVGNRQAEFFPNP